MTIERRLSPEEEELLAKKVELDGLTDQLGQKALELQTNSSCKLLIEEFPLRFETES